MDDVTSKALYTILSLLPIILLFVTMKFVLGALEPKTYVRRTPWQKMDDLNMDALTIG